MSELPMKTLTIIRVYIEVDSQQPNKFICSQIEKGINTYLSIKRIKLKKILFETGIKKK